MSGMHSNEAINCARKKRAPDAAKRRRIFLNVNGNGSRFVIQRISIILAWLAIAGGVLMLGVSAKYGVLFLLEPENTHRHEYLQGVVLTAVLAAPFWFTASGLLWLAGSKVNKKLRITVHSVSLFLCVSILASTVIPVIFVVLGGG